ncbi:sensor histidine kinase [Amycolatopsis tolypomycina]|uniref:sensor histidine kinase n=1 Tax=Amycolatopsis tolypomycina TaxID=208445 RepID=UPI000A8D0F9A|nr:ATP-binding protein [Amycolatopsis tolypomycina]
MATSERGVTHRQPVDLAHVATGILRSRRDQAAEKGIDIAEHLTPAVTTGDPRLIESLIANLVDNAIRHNHPAGRVVVTTEVSRLGAAITVTNSGPDIREDQLHRLFQPFQRLSADRNDHHSGHGLGLAIVNAVAEAHHATLTTIARPQGGLTVTVHFVPLPERASPQDAPGVMR